MSGQGTLRVRDVALEIGKRLGRKVRFHDLEANSALLSDATRCGLLFGKPKVGLNEMLEWVTAWILSGGRMLGCGPALKQVTARPKRFRNQLRYRYAVGLLRGPDQAPRRRR